MAGGDFALIKAVEGFESMDLKDAGLGNRVLRITLSSEEGQGGVKRKEPGGRLLDSSRL